MYIVHSSQLKGFLAIQGLTNLCPPLPTSDPALMECIKEGQKRTIKFFFKDPPKTIA